MPTNYTASCLHVGLRPQQPGKQDITIQFDISRTDQELIGVHSNINVGHSPYASSLSPTNSEFRSWEG